MIFYENFLLKMTSELKSTNLFNSKCGKPNKDNVHKNKLNIFNIIKSKDGNKFHSILIENLNKIQPCEVNPDNQTILMYACKLKRWNNANTILDKFGKLAITSEIDCNGYDLSYYSHYNKVFFDKIKHYFVDTNSYSRVYKNKESFLTTLMNNKENYDIKPFIKSVKNIDHCNIKCETALIIACKNMKFENALSIINHGANLTYHDLSGNSALSYLISNINNTDSSEIIHVCLRLITKANYKSIYQPVYEDNIKIYEPDQFTNITNVNNAKGSYGNIKWAIDSCTGEQKMLKHYYNYNNHMMIKSDMVKEIIFLRKMNSDNNYAIHVDGIYVNDNGDYYVVFEILALTLNDFFKIVSKNIDLLKNKVTSIFEQLNNYVTHMHHLGILHNDIKSDNIMIGYNGKIKILDFGLSEFIGYSPNKSVSSNYITTSRICAPDFGKPIKFKVYDEQQINIVDKFTYESNRKSYASDIYSLGVTIIQCILLDNRKFICVENVLYYLNTENAKDKYSVVIVPVKNSSLIKLKIYSFYDKLLNMVNVDSQRRISRRILPPNIKVNEYSKHSVQLIKNIVHYQPNEIKNQMNEMVYAENIFKSYKDVIIKTNGRNSKINYKEIFDEIITVLPNRKSIDCILNSMYHTINYKGTENISIIFISYLYIFSYIFEWYIYDLDKISSVIVMDRQLLITKLNNTIIELLTTVSYIPFVVSIEKIIILLQMNSTYFNNDVYKVEENIYNSLYVYFSKLSDEDEFNLWDFVVLISSNTISLPFSPMLDNNILQIYEKFK